MKASRKEKSPLPSTNRERDFYFISTEVVRDLNEFDKCNQYLENRRREHSSKLNSDVVSATSAKKAENNVVSLHEKATLDPQSLFNLRQRARIVSVKNPIFDRY